MSPDLGKHAYFTHPILEIYKNYSEWYTLSQLKFLGKIDEL